MTDVVSDATAPSTMPSIRVVTQFMRDFSFENPRAPDSLRATEAQPGMELSVELSARGRPDGLFEVDLKIGCTAKQGDAVAFQIELLYGGLFEVANVPEEHLEPVLLIECPRFLFPFARQIIAEASANGGFPPFMMEPLDFGLIYQQRLQAQAQQAGESIQ